MVCGSLLSWFLRGSGVALADLAEGAGEDDLLNGPVLLEPGDRGRATGSESVAGVVSEIRIGRIVVVGRSRASRFGDTGDRQMFLDGPSSNSTFAANASCASSMIF